MFLYVPKHICKYVFITCVRVYLYVCVCMYARMLVCYWMHGWMNGWVDGWACEWMGSMAMGGWMSLQYVFMNHHE